MDRRFTFAKYLSIFIFVALRILFILFQRPPKLSLGLPHPDPVVETSSLSAVQPPEPTYTLTIMNELNGTNVLSCLQIETVVYACQVSYLLFVCHFLLHEVNMQALHFFVSTTFFMTEASSSSPDWCQSRFLRW
jgi:hypothetical protein